MAELTVGSLFSGIGGIDLGLTRAGMSVKWMVEKDEYARKVLKKHWPEVTCHEDIKNTHGKDCFSDHDGCLERVDVLAGGFPCQDISVAGKGAGIKEGTRSGLWSEFARLVREIRPRYVLIENVPALRSRGLGRVLGDLAACGYDAEWDCFPASAFGAPHKRDRIFIVAYPKREFVRVEPGRGGGQDWPDTVFPPSDGEARFDSWASKGPAKPLIRGVDDGLSPSVDRLRTLGNAVVPAVAEQIGKWIVAHAERNP